MTRYTQPIVALLIVIALFTDYAHSEEAIDMDTGEIVEIERTARRNVDLYDYDANRYEQGTVLSVDRTARGLEVEVQDSTGLIRRFELERCHDYRCR